MLEYFATLVHIGLINGGGAVFNEDVSFEYSTGTGEHPSVGLMVFDMLFFIIITVILINCVFGIMLDTFAALREHEEEQNDSVQNHCFICCEHRSSFASHSDFKLHREREHNPLHYLCLLEHIERTPPSRRNGFCTFVAGQVAAGEIGWLPIGQSIRLQERGGAADKEAEEDDEDSPRPGSALTAEEMAVLVERVLSEKLAGYNAPRVRSDSPIKSAQPVPMLPIPLTPGQKQEQPSRVTPFI